MADCLHSEIRRVTVEVDNMTLLSVECAECGVSLGSEPDVPTLEETLDRLAELAARIASGHDVSGEARGEHGRWTTSEQREVGELIRRKLQMKDIPGKDFGWQDGGCAMLAEGLHDINPRLEKWAFSRQYSAAKPDWAKDYTEVDHVAVSPDGGKTFIDSDGLHTRAEMLKKLKDNDYDHASFSDVRPLDDKMLLPDFDDEVSYEHVPRMLGKKLVERIRAAWPETGVTAAGHDVSGEARGEHGRWAPKQS